MSTHLLKCWPSFFRAMKDGHKKVDIRRFDRDFAVADYLIQMEWIPEFTRLTGEVLVLQVTHMLSGSFGLRKDYVAMSVTELTKEETKRVLKDFFDQGHTGITHASLREKLIKQELLSAPPDKQGRGA